MIDCCTSRNGRTIAKIPNIRSYSIVYSGIADDSAKGKHLTFDSHTGNAQVINARSNVGNCNILFKNDSVAIIVIHGQSNRVETILAVAMSHIGADRRSALTKIPVVGKRVIANIRCYSAKIQKIPFTPETRNGYVSNNRSRVNDIQW